MNVYPAWTGTVNNSVFPNWIGIVSIAAWFATYANGIIYYRFK